MRPTVLLLVAVALSACELSLAGDVIVEADGSGTFEVQVALDPELHELLLDAGMDPLLGLDQLRTDAPEWQVEQQAGADGGLALTLRTGFDDPAEFAELTDGLHAAIDDQDGRLWDQLRLEVDGGTVSFTGGAGLIVPRFPGADGVAFDEDELAELVAERGDEFVRYELRVTLPGEVGEHDADELSGSTLVWRLPVGQTRTVAAASELAVAGTPLVLVAVGLVAAVGTAVTVMVVRTRRAGSRRRAARHAQRD